MAVVVVGGQKRGVGKTSVVCGLIAVMSERRWTAVKLSAHGHSAGVEVYEEVSAGVEKDSARYLTAGAVRSFYITAPEAGLWRAIPPLLEILAEVDNAVVESTSVLAYLRPELALAVVDPALDEVKTSLQKWGERFDAVVATGGAPLSRKLRELMGKPRLDIHPPEYGSEELTAFVKQALVQKSSAP